MSDSHVELQDLLHVSGFDRSSYVPRNPATLTADERQSAQVAHDAEALAMRQDEQAQVLRQCFDQGLMLLEFLRALETRLKHDEAVALAAQVWRAQ